MVTRKAGISSTGRRYIVVSPEERRHRLIQQAEAAYPNIPDSPTLTVRVRETANGGIEIDFIDI